MFQLKRLSDLKIQEKNIFIFRRLQFGLFILIKHWVPILTALSFQMKKEEMAQKIVRKTFPS